MEVLFSRRCLSRSSHTVTLPFWRLQANRLSSLLNWQSLCSFAVEIDQNLVPAAVSAAEVPTNQAKPSDSAAAADCNQKTHWSRNWLCGQVRLDPDQLVPIFRVHPKNRAGTRSHSMNTQYMAS